MQELGGGGAPHVLGSGRGRGSSVPRVEEEGSSELDASLRTVLGSGRGRGVAALAAAALLGPYGPRLGPGTRGGGVGGGAPWLETTAALGRGQGGDGGERREATTGSGARRRKKLGQRRTGSRRKTTVRLNTRGDLKSRCVAPTGTKGPLFSPGSWLEPGLKVAFSPGSSQEPGLNVFFSFLFIYAYNN